MLYWRSQAYIIVGANGRSPLCWFFMGDEWAELPVDKLSSLPSHFVRVSSFFLRSRSYSFSWWASLDFTNDISYVERPTRAAAMFQIHFWPRAWGQVVHKATRFLTFHDFMIATFGSRTATKLASSSYLEIKNVCIIKKCPRKILKDYLWKVYLTLEKLVQNKSPVGFLVPSLIFNRQDPFHATALLKTMYAVQVVKFWHRGMNIFFMLLPVFHQAGQAMIMQIDLCISKQLFSSRRRWKEKNEREICYIMYV